MGDVIPFHENGVGSGSPVSWDEIPFHENGVGSGSPVSWDVNSIPRKWSWIWFPCKLGCEFHFTKLELELDLKLEWNPPLAIVNFLLKVAVKIIISFDLLFRPTGQLACFEIYLSFIGLMAELRGGVLYLNDHKAGLSDLDGNSKEEVSRILTEASMGSPFFENKKLKHQAIQQRIALKKKLLEEASAEEFSEALRKVRQLSPRFNSTLQVVFFQADQLLHDTEISRDLSRTIVHVDMDMFYAAVEVRDNPSLKDKPLGVGSNCTFGQSID
jgi:impB/mucB/samB family